MEARIDIISKLGKQWFRAAVGDDRGTLLQREHAQDLRGVAIHVVADGADALECQVELVRRGSTTAMAVRGAVSRS